MCNPTPRVNLSICGHFVVILKSRSISVPIQLAFGHPFQQCARVLAPPLFHTKAMIPVAVQHLGFIYLGQADVVQIWGLDNRWCSGLVRLKEYIGRKRMRHSRRVLALIALQQIVDELVITLTICIQVLEYIKTRTSSSGRFRRRRYSLTTRMPDQVGMLHRPTKNVFVPEQVAIFLSVLSHHKKNCFVKHDFIRSGRTVSKHFHVVLHVVCKMHKVLLTKPTPIADDCSDPHWKWFKGCLGALDGTFIDVRVPGHENGRYRTRKGQVAVNVLGVCNPNMQFIFVLSGWEESAKDNRVLRDAIHRPNGLRVPTGNYYLCDNGYANADGFLTPYRGVRYHLREWDRTAGGPQNKEELFNLKHSSARNVIERTFGLLKVRWGILRSSSFYPIDVQSKIIIACSLLHNFIRNEMPEDPFEQDLQDSRELGVETGGDCISSVESNAVWSAWRDDLASSMYNEWMSLLTDAFVNALYGVTYMVRLCAMDADFFSTAHVNTLDDDGSSQLKRRGNNKDRSGPRRTWTIVEEEALINGLKSLCDLKAEPHINSKLHVWKRQYSTLCSMMAKSGLRWDDNRNMVTVDDDSAWDEFLKIDPSAKGMRYKSWPFFPAWRKIFGRDRATGDRCWDPTRAATEKAGREVTDVQQCYTPTGDWNPDTGYLKVSLVIPNKCEVVMEAVKEISGLEENDVIVVTSKLVHEPRNMDIFFNLSMEAKAKMTHGSPNESRLV
ncbi:hypothetical protein Sango_3004700 [Sesamum angolense]|uniref:Transposase n=1 Tax=Sesamum angolense TaxID=2727404 RepID=A0AAE1VZ54_9LAMI|nr:hypothetical protein Sango_3004700 [Sesamum angolense]